MYIDLDWKLEQRLKAAMVARSPRLTMKTAVIEAIEAWIIANKGLDK